MRDLRSSKAMWIKAVLFVLIAAVASGLLIAELPSWRVVLLLALVIWASCRAYYFAFYVIQHYIDPGYRFAGLGSVVVYLLRNRARGTKPSSE